MKNYDWVEAYKTACHQVYDVKLSNIENLMNGVEKERENMYNMCLDNAIEMIGVLPPDYATLINRILNTTFTNEEFHEVAKPHIEAIRKDIKEYIIKNTDSKRKFSKAEEMRAELDLANENIDKILHRENKPTLWQRVKNFFCYKQVK